MSTEPTWRVYLTEWLPVFSNEGDGPECRDHFAAKYKGRVHDTDVRVKVEPSHQVLQLRLPNLRGEFKDHGDALELAGELMDGHKDGPCDLVRRGSAEEKALLDYGKKMLPGAGTTEG